MPRRGVPQIVLGVALALALGGLGLYLTSPTAEAARERAAVLAAAADPEAEGAGTPSPRLSVEALVVSESADSTLADVAGLLEAVRAVVVGSEVAGRVVEIAAVEHSHVAEGDLLVRLDPALPEAAVARARANLLRTQAESRLAAAELRRQRELAERGVASAAELERAESAQSTGRARVAEARAALRDSQTRLDKTRITAPFAGVVSSLDLEPGAYVQPGSPVAELVDLTEIEIEVGVGDSQILGIAAGDAVRVAVDVLRGEWFEGRVLRPGRVADPQTRKYPVPVRVPNPDERLLPGMLGTVRFEVGGGRPALRIPRGAVQREFELDYVFVLEPIDGSGSEAVARRRRVATRALPFRPDVLEVTDGLAPRERIAISGVRELRDGLRLLFRERGVAR